MEGKGIKKDLPVNYTNLHVLCPSTDHCVFPERKSEMGINAPADQIKEVEKLSGVC